MPPKTKTADALPEGFLHRDLFSDFIREYRRRTTYWYVQTARIVSDENVDDMAAMLRIVQDHFLHETWSLNLQHQILRRLIKEKLLDPYLDEGSPATGSALVRMNKKYMELLGLMWVPASTDEIVISPAGARLLAAEDGQQRRSLIDGQIAKFQYPLPALRRAYIRDFKGLLPHLFLLQVLEKVGWRVSFDEFELFVNLAQTHDDLERVVRYITAWRDLSTDKQEEIIDLCKTIPLAGSNSENSRHLIIERSRRYQVNWFAFPEYLILVSDVLDRNDYIKCAEPEKVTELIAQAVSSLKVPVFDTPEDWFVYYGDTETKPTWFTYVRTQVEKAATAAEAEAVVEEHAEKLTPEEAEEIRRNQVEKDIEELYKKNLHLLEPGLKIHREGKRDGQQYETPIGRIDLLCRDKEGMYVVVEIKAEEAKDAVFGQVLRYIGWIHRNMEGGADNVRGIILASAFPDKAQYARIGLLRSDHKEFLKFKEHGIKLEEA